MLYMHFIYVLLPDQNFEELGKMISFQADAEAWKGKLDYGEHMMMIPFLDRMSAKLLSNR